MDGEQLTAPQVEQVSKWPSRTEQLSILLGQILSPGAMLASQLNSVGGALASQIEQKAGDEEPKRRPKQEQKRRSGRAQRRPVERPVAGAWPTERSRLSVTRTHRAASH